MAAVVESISTDAAQSSVGEGYRPHLDGLRAVAVYLVILFHAGADGFSGGFIGVDVFFVLSGYLVTQLLMRDLSSRGAVRFGRFYARRMRRLLPASFVTLIVTGVVYSAIASRAEVSAAENAFKAAFLYVANWFFIHQSADYFAADINTNPVVHFWSLAIEEQFYVLWPILLSALFVATRRLHDKAQRAMQVAVGVGAVASALWALSLARTNLNRAYYGTDTRAYQLLAGAFLALSPGLIRRASRHRALPAMALAPLALAMLLVLSTSMIDVTAIHRGIATAIATVVLIVAIEGSRGGPVNSLLASNPAVYLGKISYGTYLWHWPVILVARALLPAIGPFSTVGIAALVATALASLSYQILERPIREQRFLDRIHPIVIAAGVSIGVMSALVIIPRILDPYRSQVGAAQNTTQAGLTPIPSLDFTSARTDVGSHLKGVALPQNCLGKPRARCTIVKNKGQHILLIGDSQAGMMVSTFAQLAQEQGLTFSISSTGGCPWQRNLYLADDGRAENQLRTEKCIAMKRDLYDRMIPELKPDLIVTLSIDYYTKRPGAVYDKDGKPVRTTGQTGFRRLVEAETKRSLTELKQWTDKVLIIESLPSTTPDKDPFVCLTKSKFLEDCRFVVDVRPTALERMYRSIADNKRVYLADLDKLLCPYLPICDPVISGNIVRFDSLHITPKFAVSLAEPVTNFLQGAGLIHS